MCCVATLVNGSSQSVWLQGDSGFALFRNKELIFQSTPLQHFFDCPYQFASCPEFTDDTDRPEDATDYELQLQSGDVIVAATDGLWDNIHTEELLPLLPASEDAVQQVQSCAQTSCCLAINLDICSTAFITHFVQWQHTHCKHLHMVPGILPA